MESLLAEALVAVTGSSALQGWGGTDVVMALLFCVLAAPLGNLWSDFFKEFFGTAVMIVLTFSPGKWIGTSAWWHAWLWHGVGVVAADWVAGGPHVNPSVSFSFFILGELTYPALLCRVAAQLAAGLATFPLCRALGRRLGLPPLLGPSFDPATAPLTAAVLDEAAATCILCLGIYLLNRELSIRKSYAVKQSITAVLIRALLWAFPTAGTAMNPTLATAWAVFAASEKSQGLLTFPTTLDHYIVYWAASLFGALTAASAYSLLGRHRLFGIKVHWPMDGEEKKDH